MRDTFVYDVLKFLVPGNNLRFSDMSYSTTTKGKLKPALRVKIISMGNAEVGKVRLLSVSRYYYLIYILHFYSLFVQWLENL